MQLDFSWTWATTGPSVQVTNPLTDAGLDGALGRFKTVRSANLSGCNRITDAGLATFGAGYPNLESVDLSGCYEITDAGLASTGEGCPNLKSLARPFQLLALCDHGCWVGDDRRGLQCRVSGR